MSAAETIAKAIEKLEGLKADSAPGPWFHWPEAGDIEIYSDYRSPGKPNTEYVVVSSVRPRHGWGKRLYEDNYEPTAELIVTLHRTIDAQLAILRHALEAGLVAFDGHTVVSTDAVALAEAILGGAE